MRRIWQAGRLRHEKGQFVYLICRDPANPTKKLFVPEKDVLNQVKAVFKSHHIPQEIMESLTEHLKASHEVEKGFHKDAITALRKEYDVTNTRTKHVAGYRYRYACPLLDRVSYFMAVYQGIKMTKSF